ncbi:hypothetical protein [Bremerella cremea]|uniref:hypothetical protein n=1 Tax=Bremerella cremea TaxID=1031537 RepID=UPI0031EA95D2
MGYKKLSQQLNILERYVTDQKIKLADDAPTVVQLNVVREFLKDQSSLKEEQLLIKWNPRFREFYEAQIAIGRLSGVIAELVEKQRAQLAKYLKIILGGGISQGGHPEQARDYFYELWLASVLSEANFTVSLEEPDIVVEGNGLTKKIGIACKYPSSEKQIHAHLSKGYSQLEKHNLPGFVALGIDQIVIEQANLKRYVDFNQGAGNPVDVLSAHASSEVKRIVEERPTTFPSEVPADEVVVTITLGGHYGTPAKLTVATGTAIHCTSTSQINSDMQKIAACVAGLPREA